MTEKCRMGTYLIYKFRARRKSVCRKDFSVKHLEKLRIKIRIKHSFDLCKAKFFV